MLKKLFPKKKKKEKNQTLKTKEIEKLPEIALSDFFILKNTRKSPLGSMYIAKYKKDGKLYVIKEYVRQAMIEMNKVKRVFTEREILNTITHPLIISLLGCIQTKKSIYHIIEYCSGGDLYDLMQRRKKEGKYFTEEEILFYCSEILLGLEYLHVLGFIYRDLKPENILIHQDGSIRLSDFDLSHKSMIEAQKLFKKGLVLKEQETNSFVGTEEYISPEVIAGTGHSSLVDWWSFGVLMYELLYFDTPFKESTQRKTFQKIMKCDLEFPKTRKASKNIKDCIKKLLQKKDKRLGKGGITEIKNHSFFKKVKWSLVLNQKPPFLPEEKNFDGYNEITLEENEE